MPAHEPPAELRHAFTMGGAVPLATMYVDDSGAGRGTHYMATQKEVDELVQQFSELRSGTMVQSQARQRWRWLFDALAEHPVDGQEVAVFGSMEPTVEAVLLAHGASSVTTIEYNRLTFEHPQLEQLQLQSLRGSVAYHGRFAKAVSLSSFDHDGLGRYGDPVSPDGDLQAMQMVRDCLRPDGLLFLSVPTGPDLVVWNLHRRYGPVRLPRLLYGWDVVARYGWEEARLTAEAPYRRAYEPLHVLRWSGQGQGQGQRQGQGQGQVETDAQRQEL